MTETTSPDSLAYSVAGFCNAIGISPRTFWSLQAAANGPPLVRIGRRVLVRKEAAATWLKARETAGDQKSRPETPSQVVEIIRPETAEGSAGDCRPGSTPTKA